MKAITISTEAYEFLQEFVKQLETQDNRATADPYYFVVRGVRLLSARDGQTNELRYYYKDDTYTAEELAAYCKENELDLDEVMESDELEHFDVQEVDEYNNVFFTYAGYLKHMEINKHNYGHYERVDSYVMHAFRNPEIKCLLAAVKEVAHSVDTPCPHNCNLPTDAHELGFTHCPYCGRPLQKEQQ